MRARLPSVTSLPPSPQVDRRRRMILYTVAMTIRVICIVLMLFVRDWWLLVCALGAIFLPYFAVIIANQAAPTSQDDVERPGPRQLSGGDDSIDS